MKKKLILKKKRRHGPSFLKLHFVKLFVSIVLTTQMSAFNIKEMLLEDEVLIKLKANNYLTYKWNRL
ncbi:hypothetical protein DJ013_20175 [Arcticibacterium luteifluviistationis]|uniref:Uncharacterized protein n=1 Tax=Arcticibacterium luteifluviistationis TaxID=1784714 RepID=A0A2Z4GHS0_9BACT|nr:hypothetical protein DJ013_20175 [Arcticibacterium luteifluviistationis]